MDGDQNRRVVARIDAGDKATVLSEEFSTRWNDGTRVEHVAVEQSGDTWVLQVRGKRSWRRCRSLRTPLEKLPDGSLQLPSGDAATTETCSGTFCSSCDFTSSGFSTGCKCNDWIGWCSHTISHLDDFPDLLKVQPPR